MNLQFQQRIQQAQQIKAEVKQFVEDRKRKYPDALTHEAALRGGEIFKPIQGKNPREYARGQIVASNLGSVQK
jgi:hypothetical protein